MEDADPEEEDVGSVLAQESSELLRIITSQTPSVQRKLCEMIPRDAEVKTDQDVSSSPPLTEEHVRNMLEDLSRAKPADCRNFFQSVCMLCENIPMRLESKLLSVALLESGEYETMLFVTDVLRDGARASPHIVRG